MAGDRESILRPLEWPRMADLLLARIKYRVHVSGPVNGTLGGLDVKINSKAARMA